LTLGLFGFAASGIGIAVALLPRHFTASQQQQIMSWQIGGRWRNLPAGQIFPHAITYRLPVSVIQGDLPLDLQAVRVAIAPASGCAAAVTDSAAASLLHRNGCQAVLRATYVDETSSFVVTVGVAVLPTPRAATTVSSGLAGTRLAAARAAVVVPAGVRTVHFTGAAAALYDYIRQISATMPAGPYLVMYAAGYADGRPHVQLAHDSYSQAEMASMAQGVASSVANGLGSQPATPHCPGDAAC